MPILLSLSLVLMATNIETELSHLHWRHASESEIQLMDSGFRRIAKLPLNEVRSMIVAYTKAPSGKIASDDPLRRELHDRHTDVGVLNRLIFVNVPSFSSEKTRAGLNTDIASSKPWRIESGKLGLYRCENIFVDNTLFDSVVEFDYCRKHLKLRVL